MGAVGGMSMSRNGCRSTLNYSCVILHIPANGEILLAIQLFKKILNSIWIGSYC